ncbi:hypothetical protein [uncultured Maricaulis sp.]|uniref:hypothetical protein n=1 Tax=uncultured Maricaulis sp. TaxID=174710 RepID=UPI00261FC6F2|nr:hypothetical protein [uncultured Maricaulis sp.]
MNRALAWLKNNHTAITSLAAILISAIALFVAWDQSRVMRAQQHADVWPAVQIETQMSTEEGQHVFLVAMTNDGIGPALVGRVEAGFAGQALQNWEEMGQHRPEGLPYPNMWTGGGQGVILAPGESTILAQISWPVSEERWPLIRDYQTDFFALTVEACFCSVYGRCWTARREGRTTHPEPIDACPVPDPDTNL